MDDRLERMTDWNWNRINIALHVLPNMHFCRRQVSLFAVVAVAAFAPSLALISESCAQESMALVGQRALQEAADQVETQCQPSSASGFISYNYDDCAAKDAFLAACSTAGGKVLRYNVDISCSQDAGSGISIKATNVPECVGMSCGKEGLATKNDRVFSSLEQQLKGAKFICSVNGGSSMTEPSAPPLDVVPTIVPSLPAEQEDGIVDAGIPTDAPTRDGAETIISFGDNDSSGAVADMLSISALMIGLVSAFFALG